MSSDPMNFLPSLLKSADALADEIRSYATRSSAGSQPDRPDDDVGIARRRKAKSLLAERSTRSRHLPPVFFHEPAWDILLCSYLASFDDKRQSVKQLVGLIDAPATTSQRWIDQLVSMGYLDRETDAKDRRRFIITQSSRGIEAMNGYIDSVRTV